jgi:hypothetical protein
MPLSGCRFNFKILASFCLHSGRQEGGEKSNLLHSRVETGTQAAQASTAAKAQYDCLDPQAECTLRAAIKRFLPPGKCEAGNEPQGMAGLSSPRLSRALPPFPAHIYSISTPSRRVWMLELTWARNPFNSKFYPFLWRCYFPPV